MSTHKTYNASTVYVILIILLIKNDQKVNNILANLITSSLL
ncbi:Hypothetical protein MCYN_0713 [Mycoplasmopsis cynos C142]|uniref:Uncharacterized protein n=1 Tax=Mycoplasmopsis cynos (strain C142) TaxID=1246955 RepID=L0RY56_MYCC1|nr:Hypothetical protein MCYN_0713 [Mycoplasmopsis cynos C142]